MKTETLQALLIDRSLGELDAPTAELLEAYLAQDAAAAAEAQKFAALWQEMKQAGGEPATANLPAPTWLAETNANRWTYSGQKFVQAAWPLAACVALGLGVGWSVGTHSPAPSPGATPLAPAVAAAAPRNDGSSPFWRLDNPVFASRNRRMDTEKRGLRPELWQQIGKK